MADTAKVIRIELRVGGGGESSTSKSSTPKTDNSIRNARRKQLAIGTAITVATQLLSEGIRYDEIIQSGSQERKSQFELSFGKMALSSALIAGGFALGGAIGGALSIAVNKFVVDPVFKGAGINIQRGLDQTRATNRFYQTTFGGQGNYVFNYSSGTYMNEDLYKVNKGSFYKKGSAI